jgi:Biotin carboxylase
MNSGISTGGLFIDSQEISKQVSEIAKELKGLYGPIGFQFKLSKDNKFSLLESNPRLQGTSVASIGLDYNYPAQAVSFALSGNLDLPMRKSGIRFRRFYDEIFYKS